MICSNCGKDIPFTGNVCPYCKTNKAGDKKQTLIIAGCVLPCAAIGAMIDVCYGPFVGLIVGMIVAAAIISAQKKSPGV